MLKIKEGIPLRILLSYGFIKVKKGMTDFVPEVNYWYTLNNSEYDCITVFKDRTIYFRMDCYGETYDVIYDLINDGLVEKVEE